MTKHFATLQEAIEEFDKNFVLAADKITGLGDRVPSYLGGNQIKSFLSKVWLSSHHATLEKCKKEHGDTQ